MHFLIFRSVPGSHSYVSIANGSSLLSAICSAITSDDASAVLLDNGGLTIADDSRTISYPHPLAYVEANYKIAGAWDIRHLPETAWSVPYFEGALVTENPDCLNDVVSLCKPLFRKEYPRKRCLSFVWRLESGKLVSFCRKTGPFQIEVLVRYLVSADDSTDIMRWTGTYDDLLKSLWTGPVRAE